MGNLRDKYTNEEWDALVDNINKKEEKENSDIKNGKPCNNFLQLCLENKTLEELEYIQSILSDILSKDEMVILEKWIKWKYKEE